MDECQQCQDNSDEKSDPPRSQETNDGNINSRMWQDCLIAKVYKAKLEELEFGIVLIRDGISQLIMQNTVDAS